MKTDTKLLDSILSRYSYDKTKLIAIMQAIQEQYRYLPQDAMEYTAEKLGISEAKLYGVATFYENFSLEPKGKYVIKCCNGTACHVRGSQAVQEAMMEAIGLSEDKRSSDDGLFTVERVSCLGACGLAPVCTVNDKVYGSMTPDKIRALIRELKEAEGL